MFIGAWQVIIPANVIAADISVGALHDTVTLSGWLYMVIIHKEHSEPGAQFQMSLVITNICQLIIGKRAAGILSQPW